ncbi:MAG: hypothetical protein AAGD96_01480 [Chloroflexota bacterium]
MKNEHSAIEDKMAVEIKDSGSVVVNPPKKRSLRSRIMPFALAAFVLMFAVACVPTGATGYQPAAGDGICEIYVNAIEWIRIICGLMAVLALGALAIKRIGSSIMPDIPVNTGAIVTALVVGLIFAGFGDNFANGLSYVFMGTFIDCSASGVTGPLG